MNKKTYERISVYLNQAKAPLSFRWRGRVFKVDAIERIWRNSYGNRQGQRYYRIRCRNRSFLLHHDQVRNRWSVVTSPWRTRLGLTLSGVATRLAA